MADISDIEKDIVEALRGEPLHQSDSEILRRLIPSTSLPLPTLVDLHGYAHALYAKAIAANIEAMNAERERLKRAIHRQRRELEGLRERAAERTVWFGVEKRVDEIRVIALQRRRLGEEVTLLAKR